MARLAHFSPAILALVILLQPAVADFVDEFEDVENWHANNRKTPPQFTTDGEVLTLVDPPGGEVTWGTSIYRNLGGIDLDATPFFVARLVEAIGTFSVTMINKSTGKKAGGLAALDRPGLAVINVPDTLGWTAPRSGGPRAGCRFARPGVGTHPARRPPGLH